MLELEPDLIAAAVEAHARHVRRRTDPRQHLDQAARLVRAASEHAGPVLRGSRAMTQPGHLPLTRLLDERACERLVVEFVRRLDLGDLGEVAELFTRDGIWEWPHGGRLIQGREDLWASFGSRPVQRTSPRLCTNVLIDVEPPARATGISYLVTYRLDDHDGSLLPPPHPTNVGHYTDAFVKVDGTWLLQHRVTHPPSAVPTAAGMSPIPAERVGAERRMVPRLAA